MKLRAHAKVNFGLNVTGRRDDGYHDLDTLFVRLELHDVLEIEPADDLALTVHGADLPTDAANLAYLAAERYLEQANASGGVHLTLTKHIPIAAGLGGGSSDAGAVLRGLARLYPAEVDLLALALSLGADVPFFVRDVPVARGRGRGEVLDAVTLPTQHLVLVNPGIQVSAKDAYARLEKTGSPLELATLLEQLKAGEEPTYRNDLQAGVLSAYPGIAKVIRVLQETPLRGVLMSGSGSTCLGLARDEYEAADIAASLRAQQPNWWARATYTF